jgi:hypothetical protein
LNESKTRSKLTDPTQWGREPTEEEVRQIVSQYPKGAPLAVIGEAMGITASAAQLVVKAAQRKFVKALAERGITCAAHIIPNDHECTGSDAMPPRVHTASGAKND